MANKWDAVAESFERAHNDLFSQATYTAEFFNYSTGTYDPDTGEIDGQTRSSIGSIQVEVVPPSMDTSIENEGHSFDWDTSIRFPTEDKPGDLVPLGEDNERPTEVEIEDDEESADVVYELHGYSVEKGSGMVMCRLVEQ